MGGMLGYPHSFGHLLTDWINNVLESAGQIKPIIIQLTHTYSILWYETNNIVPIYMQVFLYSL